MFTTHKLQGAGGVGGLNLELIGYHYDASSLTVTKGVDYEDGDLLFCYMHHYSNGRIDDESGWTLINRAQYSSYQSFAFSYIVGAASSYTVNNGNYHNIIVVFRPTGYTNFVNIGSSYGVNGGTANLGVTDSSDSLYIGFGSATITNLTDNTVPAFATTVVVNGGLHFYYAYLPTGHGNVGTYALDVGGTFELCSAAQIELT